MVDWAVCVRGLTKLRTTLFMAAALGLSACASPFPTQVEESARDRIAEVLADAYEKSASSYVAGASIADLAVSGLSNLSDVDPSLSVQETEQQVSVLFVSKEIHRFNKPAAGNAEAWGKESAAALFAAHEVSWLTGKTSLQRLFENHLHGVARALGDDSRYFPNEEFFDYARAAWQGTVDLRYHRVGDGLQLVTLDPAGSLEANGVAPGDVVTHIDGLAVKDSPDYEVFKKLRGDEGSMVSITLRRNDGVETVKVERRKPSVKSYELIRQGGIAEYRVPSLNVRSAVELDDSLASEMRRAKFGNEPLDGLILDLRRGIDAARAGTGIPGKDLVILRGDWNSTIGGLRTGFLMGPGGTDEAVRRLASAFLTKHAISIRRGRNPQANSTLTAGGFNPSGQLPLVVLVDQTTTGAPEQVAAALQDAGRAIIVGTTTSGFGAVRRNILLFNLGAMNLHWANAYAPSGYGIEGRGVMPNICVSRMGATLEGMLQALRRGEGLVDKADRYRNIDSNDAASLAAHRALCPSIDDSNDLTRELSLAILSDPELYAQLLRGGSAD